MQLLIEFDVVTPRNPDKLLAYLVSEFPSASLNGSAFVYRPA